MQAVDEADRIVDGVQGDYGNESLRWLFVIG